jgi:hypothetical protein
MALADKQVGTVIRTMKCDNPECGKEITFDRAQEKEVFATPANQWLKSLRFVQTVDGRGLLYCSDLCEIVGVKSGSHNLPEQKQIIENANEATVKAAAQAAEAAVESTKTLKSGKGGKISLG